MVGGAWGILGAVVPSGGGLHGLKSVGSRERALPRPPVERRMGKSWAWN